MITLDQAKNLKNGTILKDNRNKNWKVTSVKTWKTRPNDVLIGLKFGLYAYDKINQDELNLVSLP
jgi:hypothetical protein